MPLRLLDRLLEHSRTRPAAAALIQAETGMITTWAGLWRAGGRVANWLRDRVHPGDAVILCSANVSEFVGAYVGILRAGCKVFPLAPQSAGPEVVAAAQGCNAAAIIGDETAIAAMDGKLLALTLAQLTSLITGGEPYPEIRDEFADSNASGAAMLLSSSGSTGRPKIVHRNAAALDAVAEGCRLSVGFGTEDCVLAAVPLCHSFGVEHGLLAPLLAGSRIILCQGFYLPVVLEQLRRDVTILPVVPFMAEALAQSGSGRETFPALRQVYSAGGPLPASVAQTFVQRFGRRIGQVYGATEFGSVTFSNPDIVSFNPASVGQPMPAVEIRIAPDSAEVAIKADSMFEGYLGATEEPNPLDADGYFCTGDLGAVDSYGNLLITGRLKLLIDVGGKKVNPLEVEQVLCEHPGVADCVVLPMPLSETVTRLRAMVTLRENSRVGPEVLRQFARERLSAYKVPRIIEVRDSLPRSPAGKILRHLIES